MTLDDPPLDKSSEPRLGSYRLVQPLGTGGMSSVFRAIHVETGVEVAVKILPRNLAKNRTVLQRFLREAKSAEALEHPNIVAIYDHGVDNGQYYLVLEFVSGGDLHDHVRKLGPMSADDAISVIKSTAEGLSFASSQGLIHRDIKPANLLRTPAGVVKIADLGLALQAEVEDERVTREGTTVGTVDYMAPEQARDSRGTSQRSDIYSLGCTLYFLLTGQPPFPGGDVTEKLTRHFTAAPPDPRDFRPELPQQLTALISKMMAKRPENRHANYDELIAALDSIPLGAPTPHASTETIETLPADVVDAPRATELPGTLAGREARVVEPIPLYAILDDEESAHAPASDDFVPLTGGLFEEPEPDSSGEVDRLSDFSMADLASIAGDEAPAIRRVEPSPRPPVRRVVEVPSAAGPPDPVPESSEVGDEQAINGLMPGQIAFGSPRVMSAEERTWLKALILGGLGLIVAVIAFHQLYRATLPEPSPEVPVEGPTEPSPPPPEVVAPAPRPPSPRPAPPTADPSSVALLTPTKPKTTTPSLVPSVKTPSREGEKATSTRPAPRIVQEVIYGPDVEARFRPEWASDEVPTQLAGHSFSVRRLSDPRDSDQKSNLRAAFEVIESGTVEIADNGPFFADDLRISGGTRLIRARSGFRPVVCLEGPRLTDAQSQAAILDLDNRTVILDGLDLIVDVKDLPRTVAAIFLTRGGSLTLHNCTLTVVNRGGLPISVFQAGSSEKPSRLRLERTLVRGSFTSLVDMSKGAADVVISQSVIVNGDGCGVLGSGEGGSEPRVFVNRSVIASRGSFVAMIGTYQGVRSRPLIVRALGSTFAHLAAPTRTSFMAAKGEGATASDSVDWLGEGNVFAGWSDWLSVGGGHLVRIKDLPEVRRAWAGSDSGSSESPTVRPLTTVADRAGPSALVEIAPERHVVLARLAVPTSMLHEKTIERFPLPVVPEMTKTNGSAVSFPGASSPPLAKSAGTAVIRALNFDADAGPDPGDLGRFLAANIRSNDQVVKVRVTGASPHVWTPVKVPEGVSLSVEVEPDRNGRVPSWNVANARAGEAAIDVRGASLVLSGLRIGRDGKAGLKSLVRVEDGHLVLQGCRLFARGTTEPGGGGLIEFRTTGTRPRRSATGGDASWPFDVNVDRPTCRVIESVLITGGVVISAESARAMIALSQCAVAAGQTAFALQPTQATRQSLEADLLLDHCTVASEKSFVTLGGWRADETGPLRPWLVSTRRCGFFGTFERRFQDSVLLRADAESFARGVLFWQSAGDAFEVPYFALGLESPVPANNRPDVSRQWSDLWGHAHFHGTTGPHLPSGSMNRWLVLRQLKPGDVQPGDLAIDMSAPKDDPPKDLGADLARLKILPSPRSFRRR